jgi:hypothetical protein
MVFADDDERVSTDDSGGAMAGIFGEGGPR